MWWTTAGDGGQPWDGIDAGFNRYIGARRPLGPVSVGVVPDVHQGVVPEVPVRRASSFVLGRGPQGPVAGERRNPAAPGRTGETGGRHGVYRPAYRDDRPGLPIYSTAHRRRAVLTQGFDERVVTGRRLSTPSCK